MSTITGTVTIVITHGNTIWGNPMHSVVLRHADGSESTVRVNNNASLNGRIDNREYRTAPHTFALTRAGRISHEVR